MRDFLLGTLLAAIIMSVYAIFVPRHDVPNPRETNIPKNNLGTEYWTKLEVDRIKANP